MTAAGDEHGGSGRARRRRWIALLSPAMAAVVAAPLGWLVTDRLERENDFCNACHLGPDLPLHIDVRRDFDAVPPASLAGVHGAAGIDGREDAAFRCIDCHGGHGFVGRARVKLLAAKDAFWWAVGSFEEPEGMHWPLWDEDCGQCHEGFDEARLDDFASPRFHQLPVHNVDLGVACVECHLVHDAGGNPDAHFVRAGHVRSQCARCHSEFEEDQR